MSYMFHFMTKIVLTSDVLCFRFAHLLFETSRD